MKYSIALLFIIFSIFSFQIDNPRTMADKIFINTRIWTGNPDNRFAEALAVSKDKILYAGTLEDAMKLKNSDSQIIDGSGKLILPGFIDSHVHFLQGGFALASVQLKDANNKEEFIQRIRDFAESMKPGEWMLEGNWDHENWGGELPTCEWIDDFTKDIPVFLGRSDGHTALANTAAMNAAGISKNFNEPVGGEIEHFPDGRLTGIFKDNAMPLISKHIPGYSDDQYDKALKAAMDYVSAQGVTSVHHMGTLADYEVFNRMLNSMGLSTRIYSTAPLAQYRSIVKKQIEEGLENPWLKLNGAKIFADGSLGSKTAAFFEPYLDEPEEKGLLMDDPNNMLSQIIEGDKEGLQIVVHAIGDKANNIILNHYETVISVNGHRDDRRMRIEHAQHLLPDDLGRFGELGVIASMQPWHLMDDGRWAERTIGHERAKTTYCFRSLIDKGAILAFGSDWFVAPPVPLLGIYAAVTRHTLDGGYPDGWIPEEKITIEEALTAYTINGAYASFEEDVKGSLEAGKLADFVILDRDLFSIDPDEIKEVKVLQTYVGGKLVYDGDL